MIDLIVTLVFSIVMLIFMAYPASISAQFITEKLKLNQQLYKLLTISLTIIYSLLIGIFLKYY